MKVDQFNVQLGGKTKINGKPPAWNFRGLVMDDCVAEPGTPDGGLLVYCYDGKLRIKDPTGTVRTAGESSEGGEPAPSTPGMMIATLSLSTAQLLALQSSPVELIPSPGAGKMIRFLYASCVHTPGNTVGSGGWNYQLDFFPTGANQQTRFLTSGLGGTVFDGNVPNILEVVAHAEASNAQEKPVSAFVGKAASIRFVGSDFYNGNGSAVVTATYFVI
jgi:hypothetical protein